MCANYTRSREGVENRRIREVKKNKKFEMAEKKNIRRKTLRTREKARRFSLIPHVCLPCICSFYNKTFNSYRNSKNFSPKVSRSFRLYRDICTPVSEDIRAHDDKNRTWKALVFKVCTVNITK